MESGVVLPPATVWTPLGERKGERWLVHDEWESWEGGRLLGWRETLGRRVGQAAPLPGGAEPPHCRGKSRIRG